MAEQATGFEVMACPKYWTGYQGDYLNGISQDGQNATAELICGRSDCPFDQSPLGSVALGSDTLPQPIGEQ